MGWTDTDGDASWFAAAHIAQLPPDTVVLHQLRHPDAVIRSFYRIGLFGDRPWRTVLANPRRAASYARHPRRLTRRLREWTDHREPVALHTDVFEEGDELLRNVRYWVEWNKLVESAVAETGHTYFRYSIESLDGPLMSSILKLIDAPTTNIDVAARSAVTPANKMPEYRARPLDGDRIWGDAELALLAQRYGYLPA